MINRGKMDFNSMRMACFSFIDFFIDFIWYGGGNSTSAEEVLQIPASLP